MINDLIKNPPDELWAEVVNDEGFMQELRSITAEVVQQEKDWGKYLFKDGTMIGLNSAILDQFVDYTSTKRMRAIGFTPRNPTTTNPVPWIDSWLSSDSVQVAPQETEISSYLVGQIDSSVSQEDLNDIEL